MNRVKAWAREFIEFYLPKHLFPYSKQPVRQTSKLIDITIAVSGSPLEVVEGLKELGFDRIYGSLK